MEAVISDMQQLARSSDDNVATALQTAQSAEDVQRAAAATDLSNRSEQHNLHELQQNIGLVSVMNESVNANNHIAKVANAQKEYIDRNLVNVQREQSLVSRRILDSVYLKDKYLTGIRLAQATIGVFAVLFLLSVLYALEKLDVISAFAIALVVVAAFVGYVVWIMTYMGRRRREAGRKLDWTPSGSMETEMMRLFGGQKAC